jgi:hypothetical protein
MSIGRHHGISARSAVAAVLSVLIFASATAQERDRPRGVVVPESLRPQMRAIPLDETAPDVRALRGGEILAPAVTQRMQRSARGGASGPFLAAIDPTRLGRANLAGAQAAVRSRSMDEIPAEASENTTYGPNGRAPTRFRTKYPSLNASLSCYWAYDANLAQRVTAEAAKGDEARLEEQSRRARLGKADEPLPAAASNAPQERELDQTEVEREFQVAGRPCRLRVTCASEQDPNCQADFVDALVESVAVVRLGD